MSMFCSNTPIFATQSWKYVLRHPEFNIFPREHAPEPTRSLHLQPLQMVPMVQVSYFSAYSKAFATYWNLVLKSYFSR